MSVLTLGHQLLALVSILGFIQRGIWMAGGSPLLTKRWVRIAPHVVDTALLATGIALLLPLLQHPDTPAWSWLGPKLVALLAYIGLGMLALRPGRLRSVRIAAFFAALSMFGYIIGVATTRSATLALF
ncbi:MAG: SirB2 family protein [Pseudomonadota bacterium]